DSCFFLTIDLLLASRPCRLLTLFPLVLYLAFLLAAGMSHNSMGPSPLTEPSPPKASVLLPGLKATHARSRCHVSLATAPPDGAPQSLAVLSPLIETRVFPSGLDTTTLTAQI